MGCLTGSKGLSHWMYPLPELRFSMGRANAVRRFTGCNLYFTTVLPVTPDGAMLWENDF